MRSEQYPESSHTKRIPSTNVGPSGSTFNDSFTNEESFNLEESVKKASNERKRKQQQIAAELENNENQTPSSPRKKTSARSQSASLSDDEFDIILVTPPRYDSKNAPSTEELLKSNFNDSFYRDLENALKANDIEQLRQDTLRREASTLAAIRGDQSTSQRKETSPTKGTRKKKNSTSSNSSFSSSKSSRKSSPSTNDIHNSQLRGIEAGYIYGSKSNGHQFNDSDKVALGILSGSASQTSPKIRRNQQEQVLSNYDQQRRTELLRKQQKDRENDELDRADADTHDVLKHVGR